MKKGLWIVVLLLGVASFFLWATGVVASSLLAWGGVACMLLGAGMRSGSRTPTRAEPATVAGMTEQELLARLADGPVLLTKGQPRAAQPQPSAPSDYGRQVAECFLRGDIAGAVNAASAAVRVSPGNGQAHALLANMLIVTGDAAGAVREYSEAFRLGVNDAPTWGACGEAKLKLGDVAGAIGDFDRALAIQPGYDGALAGRGGAYFAIQQYAGAIRDWEAAGRANPEMAQRFAPLLNEARQKLRAADTAAAAARAAPAPVAPSPQASAPIPGIVRAAGPRRGAPAATQPSGLDAQPAPRPAGAAEMVQQLIAKAAGAPAATVLSTQRSYVLRFISGKYQGTEYPLADGKTILIGRSSELDMVLVEDMVARRHAKISNSGGTVMIEDLGSTNGTFVNGEKVKAPLQLAEGDRVLIGTSIFKLVAAEKR